MGAQGNRIWQEEWGCASTPPIETDFGPGTRGSHFDEACFNNELMTGFLNSGSSNPLSKLSIATLDDLGYQVDYSQADEYFPPTNCCQEGSARKMRTRRRRLGGERGGWKHKHGKHTTLSELGLSEAQQYGQAELRRNGLHKPAKRVNGDITFVGDLFLTVLYEEEESVFEVTVISSELELYGI
jgi:hypothetical protein